MGEESTSSWFPGGKPTCTQFSEQAEMLLISPPWRGAEDGARLETRKAGAWVLSPQVFLYSSPRHSCRLPCRC